MRFPGTGVFSNPKKRYRYDNNSDNSSRKINILKISCLFLRLKRAFKKIEIFLF
jgi:hypothetical protein